MSCRRGLAWGALVCVCSTQAFAGTSTTPYPTASRGLYLSGDIGCSIGMSVSGGGAWVDAGEAPDNGYVIDEARLGSIVLGTPPVGGNPGIAPSSTYASAYQDIAGGTNVFVPLNMSVWSNNCVTSSYDITLQYIGWSDGTIEIMLDRDASTDWTDRTTSDIYIPTADGVSYVIVDDASFTNQTGSVTSYSWYIGVGLQSNMASGHFYAQTQLNLVTNY